MIEQRSAEWYDIRRGKVTSSRVAEVMARGKNGDYLAGRKNYMAELLTERLTGVTAVGYISPAMQWGTDTEPLARAAYIFHTDNAIVRVGFVEHATIAMAGCSPDGLVTSDGLVEFKCPNTAQHLDYLQGKGENIPIEYFYQMQFQMACTGRRWCDFVSFDPRLPERMRLFCWRVRRDNAAIAKIEKEVEVFLKSLSEREAALRAEFQ